MIRDARYAHTNLIAHDWVVLSRFYHEVFGCVPASSERDLHGSALDAATGLQGARLQGIHLRLPGYPPEGPTLEIFQYSRMRIGYEPAPNRPGFGHVAFTVPSVTDARKAVLARGGWAIGEVVNMTLPGSGRITWCYVTDPEGNIIELQSRG